MRRPKEPRYGKAETLRLAVLAATAVSGGGGGILRDIRESLRRNCGVEPTRVGGRVLFDVVDKSASPCAQEKHRQELHRGCKSQLRAGMGELEDESAQRDGLHPRSRQGSDDCGDSFWTPRDPRSLYRRRKCLYGFISYARVFTLQRTRSPYYWRATLRTVQQQAM
jgi:hypothetical protein